MSTARRNYKPTVTAVILILLTLVLSLPAAAATKNKAMTYKGKENGVMIYSTSANWGNSKTTAYHKLKLKKSGYLVIGGAKLSGNKITNKAIKITLLDKKKNVIQPSANGTKVTMKESKMACYGVKAGTYYIRVKNTAKYTVYAGLGKLPNHGGASKEKAYSIAKENSVTGILAAGEPYTQSHWYCIKPTAEKVSLSVSVEGSGAYYLELSGPDMAPEKNTYVIKSGKALSIGMEHLTVGGTYYVRIFRKTNGGNRRGSGICEFYWE